MSWLNNSLSTLKGQLTNFAQEVLAENNPEEEELNPFKALEESQKRNEELNLLCSSKDNEIAVLKRQIAEFQAKCAESGRSSKSSFEKNASLEDSWIWEPDNVPSDSSAKNDHEANSESSSGGEMINIPLDIATNESGSYEKISKTEEQRDQKLKKLIHENSALYEKVTQLTEENKILNGNLEELDSQHNDAIQKLLDVKNELQEKYNKINLDYEKLKELYENEKLHHQNELDIIKKNLSQYETLNNTYLSENNELKKNLETLKESITIQNAENVTIKNNIELKEKELLKLTEIVENLQKPSNEATSKLQEDNAKLKKILEELGLDIEQLKDGKTLKDVFIKRHRVEDGFIVLEDDDLDGINWKQKYNELLEEKETLCSENSTQKDLESQIELLKNTILSLEKDNKNHFERIKILQNSILSDNPNIYKRDETDLIKEYEDKIQSLNREISELQNQSENLQVKVILLEKDNSVLKAQNEMNFERIEELKKSATIDPEDFEEIKVRNENLQQHIDTVNEEFMEYQEEQTKIRTKLEQQLKHLQNQIDEAKISSNISEHPDNSEAVRSSESNENIQKGYDICTNFDENITRLEKEIFEMTNTNQELMNQLKNFQKLQEENIELQEKINELTQLNEKSKATIEKLKLKVQKCEESASDMESKLMMENVDLQKRLIDMKESSLTRNPTEKQVVESFYSFAEIKELFSTYLQSDLKKNDKNSVETVLKSIRDKIWKIDILERNLKQMSDEISRLVSEKSTIEHEKNTLQADILNYEIECGELMKNNEILLNELENYKHNKLETIHENNEESIVVLEKQLEDCNNLNKTLEDEYKELTQRLDEVENERKEYLLKIQNLQDTNNNLNLTVKDLELQVESLESEKCNLVFEINEMKTDDKKSALESEMQEYRNKISNLEGQLERLNKDHADLVAAMQSQQNSIIEHKREADISITNLQKTLIEKENEIKKLHGQIKDFEDIISQKSALENDLKKLTADNNQLQNLLQEKDTLVEKSKDVQFCDHEKIIQQLNTELGVLKQTHSDEVSQLKKEMEILNNEKSELVQVVTIKHNENLQYYMEIQRLSQLLQTELAKSQLVKDCENCINLQNDIAKMTKANTGEVEKLKDQIKFLMEKSDILTTNLLTEQTNQKLLQQEKAELIEQNNSLKRDLERLREHLVELEEAHTLDTLEMQKIIDETKTTMRVLEEEAANSNNAYTSASIRANQQAETLQVQYQLVSQQRDELAAKLSSAEDRESKNQAALVNLQCALEQFQKEKEKDIQIATHRIRNELHAEQEKQIKLQNEIAALNQQLVDANQGLLAAARLSDQLEISQLTISSLKEEITNLQNKKQILDEKLRITESSQADKIEKTLIKSLIIGYIVSNNQNDKSQILRMMTIVLGFDSAEIDKIGLNKNQTGWLGGLLHMGSTVTHGTDSLTRAFINFLEQESRPRNDTTGMPNLLNIVSDSPSTNSTTTSSTDSSTQQSKERKLSESRTLNQPSTSVQPMLLNENVLEQFAPTRNSSSILKDILSDS